MKQPVLVIMAAGMGSRFGGAKQIAPVDEQGHVIIDFSLFDAYRAGFRDLIFIIKPEMEAAFREAIGNRNAEIICFPEQVTFLRSFLGNHVRLRTVTLDSVEEALQEDWRTNYE